MHPLLAELLDLLRPEPLEANLFRGRCQDLGWGAVFGGQVVGQALSAAEQTVEADRPVHSLHGYFLRQGAVDRPIVYEVDRIRDGKSFTTRRVVAIQHGKAIFSLAASFQIDEPGYEHQARMPDVPMPEELPDPGELYEKYLKDAPEHIRRFWLRERPIEFLPVSMTHYISREPLPPVQHMWIRANGTMPADRRIQSAFLAYLSDMTLLDTSLFPHGSSAFDRKLQAASLDHSMWFHAADPLDDWLLYATDSPFTGGARGLSRGSIFSRSGRLIASVAQEGLIRKRADD